MFFSKTQWEQLFAPFIKYFLQTPDKRSETIFPYKISPDLSDSQIHDWHFIFYRVQVRDWDGHFRCLILCSVTHFCFDFDVCFWITVLLEEPNMAHDKISSRGCQVLFFICWYLNPWCHVSEQDVQELWQKIRPTVLKIQQSISFYTNQSHIKCLLPKSFFFHLSIERLKINWHYWNFKLLDVLFRYMNRIYIYGGDNSDCLCVFLSKSLVKLHTHLSICKNSVFPSALSQLELVIFS